MNIFICAGKFDETYGKPSGWVRKFASRLNQEHNVFVINAGNIDSLRVFSETFAPSAYECVIWMPDIDNSAEKILPKLRFTDKTLLVQSKLNNDRYSKDDLLQRMQASGADFLIECNKNAKSMVRTSLLNRQGEYLVDSTSIDLFADKFSETIKVFYEAL